MAGTYAGLKDQLPQNTYGSLGRLRYFYSPFKRYSVYGFSFQETKFVGIRLLGIKAFIESKGYDVRFGTLIYGNYALRDIIDIGTAFISMEPIKAPFYFMQHFRQKPLRFATIGRLIWELGRRA